MTDYKNNSVLNKIRSVNDNIKNLHHPFCYHFMISVAFVNEKDSMYLQLYWEKG